MLKDAIVFVGKFAEAAGKDMRAYAKTLLTVLINNLSFKDAGIR